MLRRKRFASNRHWVFVKEEILSPLNDRLAIRHGAEYQFEVPEDSFDWDVRFAVIKDRSGNNLKEQYANAWVQPALIAPGEVVHQLGVRINWRNKDFFEETKDPNSKYDEDGFIPEEVSALMAKTDEILGSPLKTEDEEGVPEEFEETKERPDTVTNQKKESKLLTVSSHPNCNVNRVMKIASLLKANDTKTVDKEKIIKPVEISIYAIKTINNAKSLNSLEMQQVEVQSAYGALSDMINNRHFALLGLVVKSICDKLRSSEMEEYELYDILSKITRSISSNERKLKIPDQKLQVVNNIETDVMSLLNDTSINGTITSYFDDTPNENLEKIFKLAEAQFRLLRDKSMRIDLSDDPAPQVIEEYVEEIK